jgi:hypothetical protein
LIRELIQRGHTFYIFAPDYTPATREAVCAAGAIPIDYPLNRTENNPLHDLRTLGSLWHLLRQLRPDTVLPYNIKPVIYGTLAAALAGVPVVATATGGLADQVRQMRGVLTPPNNPQALAQGILQAYGQQATMPAEWDPHVVAEGYWTMYQRVCAANCRDEACFCTFWEARCMITILSWEPSIISIGLGICKNHNSHIGVRQWRCLHNSASQWDRQEERI